MAAIDTTHALVARNWATDNKGPMAVFVMVGLVAIGLIFLIITKQLAKRKAAKAAVANKA